MTLAAIAVPPRAVTVSRAGETADRPQPYQGE